MADTFSTTKRSEIMSRVKGRDSAIEQLVAKSLRRAKIRYRRDVQALPGRPDFVIVEAPVVLFVHGCWWHGHDCPRGDRLPKSNVAYWTKKLAGNRRRDRRAIRELRRRGYSVWILWECRLRRHGVSRRLLNFLEARVARAGEGR